MTEREALKLALEALEEAADAIDSWGSYASGYFQVKHDLEGDISKAKSAIAAIKEVLMSGTDGAQPEHGWTPERIAGMARLKDAQDKKLAQLEQEPVTWRYKIVDVFGRPAWTLKTPKSDTRVLESQPLYTTPPQRKPLTDEEITDAVQDAGLEWHYAWTLNDEESSRLTKFARAIEAAVWEKQK